MSAIDLRRQECFGDAANRLRYGGLAPSCRQETDRCIVRPIDRLLKLLERSPEGAVFNPWWQVDPQNHIGPQAPGIRRRQLRAYLLERIGNARLMLVGEALGYRGGHFTGLAMTSERILLGGKAGIDPLQIFSGIEPRPTSRPESSRLGFSEPTASLVWSTMLNLGVPADRFVLWTVFPWHSFNPRAGMLSNRMPTRVEVASGAPLLKAFLKLFRCECVAAVGRIAASQLPSAERLRHPASGGATLFCRQIAALVDANRHLLLD